MTQRRRLDAFLVEQAREAGAEFRDGFTAGRHDRGRGRDRRRRRERHDGTRGRPRRPSPTRSRSRATPPSTSTRFAGRAWIEFGVVPGGYGWVFPKGDHVNVGVGGWHEEGPRLRAHLAPALPRARDPGERARPTSAATGSRFGVPARPPARGRLALVGDAAGLVDPVSGDGIYEAVLSARLAAPNALDILAGRSNGFAPYAGELRRRLAVQAAASWRAKTARRPLPEDDASRCSRAPLAWRGIESLLRGRRRGAGGDRRRRAARLSASPRPSPGSAHLKRRTWTCRCRPGRGMDLDQLLTRAVQSGATDLHLKFGRPPVDPAGRPGPARSRGSTR